MTSNKKINVVFSKGAEEIYVYLKLKAPYSKTENMMLKAIHKKIDFIKENVHYGDAFGKKLIPLEYKLNYGVSNLFRVELPLFWRMIYTLTNNDSEIEIIAFVLDIIDHKTYNKKFKYKE